MVLQCCQYCREILKDSPLWFPVYMYTIFPWRISSLSVIKSVPAVFSKLFLMFSHIVSCILRKVAMETWLSSIV